MAHRCIPLSASYDACVDTVWLPRVVSMGCQSTARSGACDWHQHAHDELCLVSGDRGVLGHAGERLRIAPGTLFLFRRGEQHGYWNDARLSPHLFVVHFQADDVLYRDCPRLASSDPAQRVWRLSTEQQATFTGLFLKVLEEHRRRAPDAVAAESAWLRLLLVAVNRWALGETAAAPAAQTVADPELLALWQVVNDHAGGSAELTLALRRQVPNYDSLRHRFRKVFGTSPARMMSGLRMERAKNLLLETGRSIKDVAADVGYGRQHEFARAFHRHTGRTPTAWRKRPIL